VVNIPVDTSINAIDVLKSEPFVPAGNQYVSEPPSLKFSDRLKSALQDVNHRQHVSDQSMEAVTEGRLGIHEGMINISQADISLRLMTQVRNKAMDAYKEIMNMSF
jgi:flagellar hook-basal body complex protein FliE